MQATLHAGWLSRFRQPPVKLTFGLAIGVCFTVAAWFTAPADLSGGGTDVPSAKDIVIKAIAFHGGFKALSRNVPMIRTEESEMILEGEKIAVKSEWQYQPPDNRAFQAVVKISSLQLRVLVGMNDEKGWTKVGPAVPVDLTTEQLHGLQFEFRNHVRNVQLLTTAEAEYDLAAPRAARFADRDAWQLPATNKKTKNVLNVFFDKTSGQVLGTEAERVLPTLGGDETREKPANIRVIYKSLMDVDGMKMPESATIYRDGKTVLEIRKSQVRIVEKIDPKVFAKPK
jgi:hypothetical protein